MLFLLAFMKLVSGRVAVQQKWRVCLPLKGGSDCARQQSHELQPEHALSTLRFSRSALPLLH